MAAAAPVPLDVVEAPTPLRASAQIDSSSEAWRRAAEDEIWPFAETAAAAVRDDLFGGVYVVAVDWPRNWCRRASLARQKGWGRGKRENQRDGGLLPLWLGDLCF
jgi:hypothetical protein